MACVTITIQDDTRCRITGDFNDKALDDLFAFRKSKFWFKSPQAMAGMWDGKTHMFHRHSGTFPIGLLPDVKKWLKSQDVKRKIIDKRKSVALPFKVSPTLGGGITLREDQLRVVEKVLPRERGIVHGSTGSGKTEEAAAIIKALGVPVTLFLTGRKKLARQTRERFATRLELPLSAIGYIQGGEWKHGKSGVYIAVVDTLNQKKFEKERRELNNACELLFIDEAHHSGSSIFYSLIMRCKARYRYGLTSTPVGRSDGGDIYLRAATGPVIARTGAKELVEKGILAKPFIYFTKVLRPKIINTDETWGDVYRAAVVENNQRNAIAISYAEQLQALGLKTLILVKELAHGKLVEEMLVDARFLHGSLTDNMIDDSVRDLESGELSTLIATSIFNEGVDIPCINAVINLAGGKSVISTIQKIGRGMRAKKTGENRLLVLDFYDKTNRYLEDHARQRITTCRGEEYTTRILGKPREIKRILERC